MFGMQEYSSTDGLKESKRNKPQMQGSQWMHEFFANKKQLLW
jgi:hypothetical protein